MAEGQFGNMDIPKPGILQLPTISGEAARMTRVVLQENHSNFHCFFNEKGFHNHLAHHVLAVYSLGAPADHIKDVYDLQALDQRPMLPLRHANFDANNWTDALGDESFYPDYLTFFNREIEASGAAATIEKYVFGGKGDMLSRVVSGALHPIIHIGYGVEFALDAVVAEGLAQGAVHSAQVSGLFPSPWPSAKPSRFRHFSTKSITSAFYFNPNKDLEIPSFHLTASRLLARRLAVSSAADGRDTLVLADDLSNESEPTSNGLDAFSVAEGILKDARLAPGKANDIKDGAALKSAIDRRREVITHWCEKWVIDSKKGWPEIVAKTEELIWLSTVILGASSRPGYKPRLDFFLMHGLNSSIFLPSLLEVLEPSSRIALLHSHFRVLVAYWISRGRPALHIRESLMSATASPLPPGGVAPGAGGGIARVLLEKQLEAKKEWDEEEGKTADGKTQVEDTKAPPGEPVLSKTDPRNPWAPIILSAIDHPDEHVTKLIRSLAFAASIWGTTPRTTFKSNLKESVFLDGSAFIRLAGIVMDNMGWVREGQQSGSWDRSKLGFDEAWEGDSKIQ